MSYYEKLKLGSFCHIDDLTSRQNANLRDGLHGLLVWEPGARRVRVLGNADDPFMKPFFEQKLVALPVDLIVTWGTPAALAAKQATRTIPIVMGASGDPVSVGIVSNLARPEGNITGFAAQNVELEAKRLELLKDLLPRLSRVAILANTANPFFDDGLRRTDLRSANSARGLDVHDDAKLHIDQIVIGVGKERRSSHRARPLCSRIGRCSPPRMPRRQVWRDTPSPPGSPLARQALCSTPTQGLPAPHAWRHGKS
jgi:hypothetical protein